MWKKHKITMLPSHSISAGLCKYYNPDGTEDLSIDMDKLQKHTNYHLYILSGDDVKVGDYCIVNPDNEHSYVNQVVKVQTDDVYRLLVFTSKNPENGIPVLYADKIISSTDPELNLPRIHTNFLVEYCDFNGMDEVLVEYKFEIDYDIPCRIQKTFERSSFSIQVEYCKNI